MGALGALRILQGQFEQAAKEFPGMMHVIAQAAEDGMHPIVPPAWKNSKPQRSKDGKYPIVPDGLASSDYCPRVWGGDIRREPDELGYPTTHWLRSSFHQHWDLQAALERFDILATESGEIAAEMDDSVLPISKAKLWVKRPQEYWVLLLHHFKQKRRWTLVNAPGEISVTRLLPGFLGPVVANVRIKTFLGGTTETQSAQEGDSYVCWFEDIFLASALAVEELLSKKPRTKEQPWNDDAPETIPDEATLSPANLRSLANAIRAWAEPMEDGTLQTARSTITTMLLLRRIAGAPINEDNRRKQREAKERLKESEELAVKAARLVEDHLQLLTSCADTYGCGHAPQEAIAWLKAAVARQDVRREFVRYRDPYETVRSGWKVARSRMSILADEIDRWVVQLDKAEHAVGQNRPPREASPNLNDKSKPIRLCDRKDDLWGRLRKIVNRAAKVVASHDFDEEHTLDPDNEIDIRTVVVRLRNLGQTRLAAAIQAAFDSLREAAEHYVSCDFELNRRYENKEGDGEWTRNHNLAIDRLEDARNQLVAELHAVVLGEQSPSDYGPAGTKPKATTKEQPLADDVSVEIDLQRFNKGLSKQLLQDLIDYPKGVEHSKNRHGTAQPKTLKERLNANGYEDVAKHIHANKGQISLTGITLQAKK